VQQSQGEFEEDISLKLMKIRKAHITCMITDNQCNFKLLKHVIY